jgi:enoyl-CoA hydratase/carnithine racemase
MGNAIDNIRRIHVPARLDARSVVGLTAQLLEATREPPRVLVLHGEDGVFCEGMDLAAISANPPDASDAAYAFARCLEIVRGAASPTLAVVDGPALGGGLGLAAACDGVLASEVSIFGSPELLFGLLPAIVLPVLLERLSPQKLRLLALRGHSVTAPQALQLGLVDDVVAAGLLPSATRRWIRTLSRPDAAAVGAFKAYTAEVQSMRLEEALNRGASLTAERLQADSVRIAARTFALGEEDLAWNA